MRSLSASTSSWGDSSWRPISWARREKPMAPPVAIMALDGMQSHRWAAPPTTSRSTSVTWAPRRAACVAAWLPAGPPPMITNRTATLPRLRGRPVDRGQQGGVGPHQQGPFLGHQRAVQVAALGHPTVGHVHGLGPQGGGLGHVLGRAAVQEGVEADQAVDQLLLAGVIAV